MTAKSQKSDLKKKKSLLLIMYDFASTVKVCTATNNINSVLISSPTTSWKLNLLFLIVASKQL